MNFKCTIGAAAFLALGSHALAQSQASCSATQAQLETNVKNIARAQYSASGDNSAPRATMRMAEATLFAQLANANLTLLIAMKCPLPREPIDPGQYRIKALQCAADMSAVGCPNVESWTRSN